MLIDTPSSDGPIAVMESPAILQYIQENYDPKNLFGFNSAAERSQVSQWLFMWHNTARNHGLTRAFMNQEGADSRKLSARGEAISKACAHLARC